jgi:peroxiredoxin
MNRKALVTAFVALGLGWALAVAVHAEVAVGDPAPDFELTATSGETIKLSAFRGKRVVLEWINPNCPFSVRHAEKKTMQGIADRHPEVVFLAINSTNPSHRDYLKPEDHLKYQQKQGIKYPVLYDSDGKVGKLYGAKTTPHMFVIDEHGKVAYAGAIDDDPRGGGAKVNYVEQALQALAAGQKPEPASTKPYGCSVKY